MRKNAMLKTFVLIFLCMLVKSGVSAFSDVDDEAVGLLAQLKIIEGYSDGSFKPDSNVTRAESVAMLMKLRQFEGCSGTCGFADVSSNHFAYDAIGRAESAGIVNGGENGDFVPDSSVTSDEFIKMLAVTLGYGDVAQVYGGYPLGYRKIANDISLYDGVKVYGDTALTRVQTARMLYNAINAPIAVKSEISGENIKYSFDKNNTVLYESYNTVKKKGVLKATSYAAADGLAPAGKKNIRLDNTVYATENTDDPYEMLGDNVNLYYNEDSQKAVYIYRTNENGIIIKSEDITGFKNNILTAETDGREKEYKISPYTAVIYNGKSQMDFSENMMTFHYDGGNYRTYGSIKLCDSDEDGIYECSVITEYDNLYISNIDKTNKSVYDKYARKTLSFDDDADVLNIYRRSGEKITFDELETDCILSYARSLDGKILNAYLCGDLAEGKITSVDDDEVIADGEKYRVAGSYLKNAAANDELDMPSPGIYGTYYLDKENQIAMIQTVYMGEYAYLFSMGKGENKKAQMKVLTESGKKEIFTFADSVNIKVENESDSSVIAAANVSESSIADEDLPEKIKNVIYENGSIKGGIVKIEKNADGKVNKLSIPMPVYENEKARTIDGLQYTFENSIYGMSFSGVCFNIVRNNGKCDIKQSVTKSGTTLTKNKTYDNVSLYDVSSLGVARIMVTVRDISGADVTEDGAVIDSFMNPTVIDSVSVILNDDGEQTTEITGYTDGKKVGPFSAYDGETCDNVANSHYSSNAGNGIHGVKMSELRPGDIIQYMQNSQGQITNIRVLFRVKDDIYGTSYGDYRTFGKMFYYPSTTTVDGDNISNRRAVSPEDKDPITQDVNAQVTCFSGFVQDIDKEALVFNAFADFEGRERADGGGVYEKSDIEKWNRLYIFGKDIKVYIVDTKKNSADRVKEATKDDIKQGDKVVAFSGWRRLDKLYIIK